MTPTVTFFEELTAEQAPQAGGKGSTLARLIQAGHPAPPGFVILTSAFEGDDLTPSAWGEIAAALEQLRAGQPTRPLAVRSSAVGEDSEQASFAGGFETVLDVREDEAVRQAIATVRRSRHAPRVAAYREAQGLTTGQEVAVVVQHLVAADFSGVLFTADPVTGSHRTRVGNFVTGLGERLVAGEATPSTFTLDRQRGTYTGPPELRPFARRFQQLAQRLEQEFGAPQDIEWAITRGRLVLLQSRPITTLRAQNPATGEWNDSLADDCLWTSTNLGEAVPDVMTPCTWSLLRLFLQEVMPTLYFSDTPPVGNIGGRAYMNLSLMKTLGAAFGMNRQRLADSMEEVFGRLPEHLEVPQLASSRWSVLRGLLPRLIRARLQLRADQPRLATFIATAPARCEALQVRIQDTTSAVALSVLWDQQILPYARECYRMLGAGSRQSGRAGHGLRRTLRRWVGDADATALMSGLSARDNPLESVAPLVALAQVARGELDRETYARRHGHRGPHEFEVSLPRPVEDPAWIDQQLAHAREAPVDVSALIARQDAARSAAWERFQQRHPRRVAATRRLLDQTAGTARTREATRSEVVRAFGLMRAFVLRAGALTGRRDALFFLSIDEIQSLLRGDPSVLAFVPARRATHARYSALPPYPALIRGRFDPFQWAADPQRRGDLFDARGPGPTAPGAIIGFPGSAGVVEGRVRVLNTPEEGGLLQTGEILVTSVTNIGWTPLFLRAAAVVTDVGAPLSHAAVVARELGLPAVVGCGNATMRLRTGDRVRVHGSQGSVEILGSAEPGV